jgi:cyclic-di-AMP phosphodiesterase PgpH
MKKIVNSFIRKYTLFKLGIGSVNNPENKEKNWLSFHWIDILLGLFLALLLTLFFPKGKSFEFSDLKEGGVYVGNEIIAPFTFSVNKSENEYANDVLKAKNQVAPVFKQDTNVENAKIQALNFFLSNLKEIIQNSKSSLEEVYYLFQSTGIVLSKEDIQIFVSALQKNNTAAMVNVNVQKRLMTFQKISKIVQDLVKSTLATGILDIDKSKWPLSTGRISIQKDQQEIVEEFQYYPDLKNAKSQLLEKLRTFQNLNSEEIKVIYQIASFFISPTLFFDKPETEARIEVAVASVPLAKDQVLAGERVIDSHERITKEHIERLRSLSVAKIENQEISGRWVRIMPFTGKFLFNIILMIILVVIIHRSKREILYHRRQVLLIALVIFLTSFIAYLFDLFNISSYLVPISSAAIILTIFFDTTIGLFVSIVISFMIGAMRSDQYIMTFIFFTVCSMAILSVSRVRNRNWIIRSIVLIACSYIVSIAAYSLINYIPVREMLRNWGFGILNGLFSPVLAFGLIIILEYLFSMTTDMTLLELSDLNQPLLRQLAMHAPGTYHHSIMVGNLAEAATETIHGNALLARVGAYYHDIGKLEKPEYFVENQTKGRNPQEKLTPSMSSLVLMNHVRKGGEMAKQYGLPKEIEAFINQHHGTALMSYFYQKALEQQNGNQISEMDFRYPGPKPRTKETAVVMLSDAIEAASRTLKEPSPSRVRGLVEQIIDSRFKAGELDESPLTLQDLTKISDAFQKILNGLFHGRIAYPITK